MKQSQLRDKLTSLRSSFTNAQLIMIGVLTIATLVGTLAFVNWVSQPSYRVLTAGATPDATKSVIAELESQGIPYKLGNEGTSVLVRSSDLGRAKLDASTGAAAGAKVDGLELFDKQGLTTSDFQQRVGYQRALQGEITRALLSISGIQTATVQLALPPERLFTKDQQAVRASVLLGSSASISPSTVNSVVQLVAASVPGLDANDVTVTDTRGRVLASGSSPGNEEDRRTELTQTYELALAAKAEGMLAEVYGPGRVTVRVAAELDLDDSHIETTTYKAASAVPIRKSSTVESFTGSGSPLPQGATGVEGAVLGGAAGGNNKYDRTETSEESVVDTIVEKSTKAPGSIERLSAAAIIDKSVSPAPDPAQIKSLVSAAIGARADRDEVVVEMLAFDEEAKKTQQEAAAAVASAVASKASGASPLFNYIRTAVGVLLLLVVLFLLRRGLRTKVETIELAATESQDERVETSNTAIDLDADLPAELKLIDVRTDELATVLRSWVADRREVVR